MNIQEIIALIERKQKSTSIMYHGTSSNFVRSILKTGLIPDPKTRSWGDPETMGADKESLYGIYLTPYVGKAKSAAETAARTNKGTPVIITIQYVSGSGGLDEDDINGIVCYAVAERYEKFIKNFDIGFNRILEDIKELTSTAFNRRSFDLLKQLTTVAVNIASRNLEAVESLEFKSIQGNPEYRQLLTQFTESVKLFPKGDAGWESENIKITRPIGFSGKTKIIKIEDLKTKQIYYS